MHDFPHIPVLLEPLLFILKNASLSEVVDGTIGAAGHSAAILEAHPEINCLIGIDKDPLALEISSKRLTPWKEKISLIHGNFSLKLLEIKERLSSNSLIILDLGVSSMQLDLDEKGFSFMRDGPLDMRMDPTQSLTAKEIVNSWDEKALGRIFYQYGEEIRWKSAAKKIVEERQKTVIETTCQLASLLDPVLRIYSKKKTIHPLTKVFQALRIAVNGELDALQSALDSLLAFLPKGAILAIITFHSLEDRLVKQAFNHAASDKMETASIKPGLFLDKHPTVKILTRKPLCADASEIALNPRSRSAKLRVIQKI